MHDGVLAAENDLARRPSGHAELVEGSHSHSHRHREERGEAKPGNATGEYRGLPRRPCVTRPEAARVPRIGREETNINRPSDLSPPYLLSWLPCFLYCVLLCVLLCV